MTRDDILILAKAGFTAQQIAALNSVQAVPAQQAAPVQQAAPAQQAIPTAGQMAAVNTSKQLGANVDPYMQKIEELTQAIQANALAKTEMPHEQTPDEILASIINPPTVKEGGK